MSRSSKAKRKRTGAGVVLLLGIAVVWWIAQEWRARHPSDGSLPPGRPEEFVRTPEQAREAAPGDVVVEGGYERYDGCRLISHRNNDGDSFHVKLPDGREAEFRLHFVDTPESQRKSYRGGDTNEVRIGHQARYFGISPDRSVALGAEAKKRVIGKLAGAPFSLFTNWKPVYRSGRFYAFLRLEDATWLHEWLVREGLARIYTEGAALPDGTGVGERERQLKVLEAGAKREGVGGWQR